MQKFIIHFHYDSWYNRESYILVHATSAEAAETKLLDFSADSDILVIDHVWRIWN